MAKILVTGTTFETKWSTGIEEILSLGFQKNAQITAMSPFFNSISTSPSFVIYSSYAQTFLTKNVILLLIQGSIFS